MDCTILVATFGDDHWVTLAEERALPSAEAQGVAVVHVHGQTLHDARNRALELAHTEWVVYLDADDELEHGYIDHMARGAADMLVPSVQYIRSGREYPPRMLNVAGHEHACTGECLVDGNWMVIGTAVRADLLRKAGGWRDFTWSEDWDAWVRCWQAGGTIEPVPDAVYRAHVRHNSRNRGQSRRARVAAHNAIARANGLREVSM